MTERTPELVLGLIGGISGILVAPFYVILGGFLSALGAPETILNAGIIGGILSVIGLIGAAFVRSHPKLAGVVMILCGFFGIFVALGLWMGTLLLIVAGIVAVIRKDKKAEPSLSPPTQPTYYCTNCGKPLTYISQIKKWYCQNCKTYMPGKDDLLRDAAKAIDEGDKELAKKLLDQARE